MRVFRFLFSIVFLLLIPMVSVNAVDEELLCRRGAGWTYEDSGIAPPSNWKSPYFPDFGWAYGHGKFGFGNNGSEVTLLFAEHTAYYFRRGFSLQRAYGSVTLRVLVDGGCVIYLNGSEVGRFNMPDGVITHETLAVNEITWEAAELRWREFPIDPSLINAGVNTLAVEVHVASVSTNNLAFDMEIVGQPLVNRMEDPHDDYVFNSSPVNLVCSAKDPQGLTQVSLYHGPFSPGSSSVLTRSGTAQTDDCEINEYNGDTPHGNFNTIKIDRFLVPGDVHHSHMLLRFNDIIGSGPDRISPTTFVESATVKVFCQDAGDAPLLLYPLTKDWIESQATWNERENGVPWSHSGADSYADRMEPGRLVPSAREISCHSWAPVPPWNGWLTWDVTEIVRMWQQGMPNYGFIITDTSPNGTIVRTSEYQSFSPILTVTYSGQWSEIATQSVSGTSVKATFMVPAMDDTSCRWMCVFQNAAGLPVPSAGVGEYSVLFDFPDPPFLVAPPDGSTGQSCAPDLTVQLDSEVGFSQEVTFYGRRSLGEPFTVVMLPDTQFYSELYPELFYEQTDWIVSNVHHENIIFVTHAGDLVQKWDEVYQWENADSAMTTLDGKVPYAAAPGNHDIGGTWPQPSFLFGEDPWPFSFYDTYFPYTRYSSEPWYGGHFVGNTPLKGTNLCSYQLVSASGVDLLFIHLLFQPSSAMVSWADSILKLYPDREAIIVTHGYIDTYGRRSVWNWEDTSTIWDDLAKPNDNVRMVLCGHMAGERLRLDEVGDRVVYQMLADYQDGWPLKGEALMRVMRFVPKEGKVQVSTWSPWTLRNEEDNNSMFELPFSIRDFETIGTITVQPGGTGEADITWPDRERGTEYEWQVTVDVDGVVHRSPLWRFVTGNGE